jgi:flagellar hook-associated protein 2
MGLQIDGLASGLDTTTIVEGLLEIQKQQVTRLNSRISGITDKQTAFKGVEAGLLSLRGSLGRLTRVQDNVFEARTATSSDDSLIAAAASSGATPGIYTLQVSSLARAHQIASQGLADADSEITEGTFGIQIGTGAVTNITVDTTNNTLQGLADSINSADAGISASIINDGSTGTPYRLLLTSNQAGTNGAITISNSLAAASGNASKPAFTDPDVQSATDASLVIGTGPGAITVNGTSNQIEDVIPGVTLDLLAADATKTVTLTVTEDVESAREAIDGFVGSFNAVLGTIDSQVRFDAETGQAGVLLGNRTIISIQDEVRNAVLQTVSGITGSTNRLSSIGITFDARGQLTVDTSRLDDVLNGRVDDVSLDDVRRLFSLSGESTKAGIEFLGGSTRTKDSASAVEVDISQAAERAVIAATSDLAASTVIDSSNNSFTVSIDSQTSAALTLADGTYTRQELADHLESAINGDSTLIGREVSVSLSGNALQITSLAYGTSSKVSSVSGTASSELGFVGTESDQGQDVVGKFIVNGVDEIAVGTGRLLIGDSENENTADLQVRVTLGSSQVQSGVDGNITVTRGLAAKLDLVLNSILDPGTGRVKTVNDSFEEQIQDIEETIARQNALVEQRQQSLIKEFIALETAISGFQSAGNFLATQLAGVSGLSS